MSAKKVRSLIQLLCPGRSRAFVGVYWCFPLNILFITMYISLKTRRLLLNNSVLMFYSCSVYNLNPFHKEIVFERKNTIEPEV